MTHAISYRELKRMYDLEGAKKTDGRLTALLEKGDLKPEDFSIKDLAEALVEDGREWVRMMDPAHSSPILEAGDAVDSTAFVNITGRVISAQVMEKYQDEAFVATTLVNTESTRYDLERIPGITKIDSDGEVVHEGMPYPHQQFNEEFQDMPRGVKHGMIVAVTKEAIFFDRTAQILDRAGDVGFRLGINKEKRLWDMILGVTNNYNWNGVAYNTYQTITPWINVHGFPLVDWTSIDNAERLFDNMIDPTTGDPILISGMTLVVMPANWATARRILSATEIRQTSQGGTLNSISGNPLAGYTLAAKSRLARQRAALGFTLAPEVADELWLLGDFKRAFAYRENWPITVTQSPPNDAVEFDQDIVARYKASERGVPAVKNPRYVVFSYGQCDSSSSGEVACVPAGIWPAE